MMPAVCRRCSLSRPALGQHLVDLQLETQLGELEVMLQPDGFCHIGMQLREEAANVIGHLVVERQCVRRDEGILHGQVAPGLVH